jgi:hypothetical protein
MGMNAPSLAAVACVWDKNNCRAFGTAAILGERQMWPPPP